MRLFHALLLVTLLFAPSLAHSASSGTAHQGRRSAAEHFADANTTHDGRLTLNQATTGYKSVARSFSKIDVAHHGYVTLEDIKAWKAAKKAARLAAKHAAADETDGVLRPAQAQHLFGAIQLRTATDSMVPTQADPRRSGGELPAAPVDGKGSL